MKKVFSLILVCALLLSCCAFADEAGVNDAKSYLYFMYKNKPETTMTDYTVVGNVMIGEVSYPIEWTADSDAVQVVYGEDGTVTVDVNEKTPVETAYVLTATIKDGDGNTASVSFNHRIPAAIVLEGLSYEDIVAAAYALEAGTSLDKPQRLFGTVTAINTAWSDQYKNITVTIQIGDLADKTVQCYRLSGDGCDKLAVGDAITVEGTLTNYKGTIEFGQGCKLIGMGEIISQTAILDAAYALEAGTAMTEEATLTGEITAINTAWSDQYKNITVTIVCDGIADKPIQCYRLCGEGCDTLAVGDVITVTGKLKNYKGTIEFDAGCTLAQKTVVLTQEEIVNIAYALETGASDTASYTLTGEVISVDTAWSDQYKNITVTIVCGEMTDKPIQCYRLAGNGADGIAIGDTITVTGSFQNYKGKIEFNQGCQLNELVKAE